MKPPTRSWRRVLLPVAVFVVVAALQYVWVGLFPEQSPAQSQWAAVPAADPSWLGRYLTTQNYWLGFSYALSLAVAAATFRRYREERCCAQRNVPFGGVTLTGVLAVAGCYLIGCCGSPMLAVYLSLFGTGFLPFAKPLVAVLTTTSIVGAWWWMNRRGRAADVTQSAGASYAATRCAADCALPYPPERWGQTGFSRRGDPPITVGMSDQLRALTATRVAGPEKQDRACHAHHPLRERPGSRVIASSRSARADCACRPPSRSSS